jgi:trans-aconitate methyltransferase
LPIYHSAFPNATLNGVDISESAIEKCRKQYGDIAKFNSGNFKTIVNHDIIIASHVMEHMNDDRTIIKI